MNRVYEAPDLAQLVREYLFALANLCSCPPPMAYELKVADFAILISDIDRYLEGQKQAVGG